MRSESGDFEETVTEEGHPIVWQSGTFRCFSAYGEFEWEAHWPSRDAWCSVTADELALLLQVLGRWIDARSENRFNWGGTPVVWQVCPYRCRDFGDFYAWENGTEPVRIDDLGKLLNTIGEWLSRRMGHLEKEACLEPAFPLTETSR